MARHPAKRIERPLEAPTAPGRATPPPLAQNDVKTEIAFFEGDSVARVHFRKSAHLLLVDDDSPVWASTDLGSAGVTVAPGDFVRLRPPHDAPDYQVTQVTDWLREAGAVFKLLPRRVQQESAPVELSAYQEMSPAQSVVKSVQALNLPEGESARLLKLLHRVTSLDINPG